MKLQDTVFTQDFDKQTNSNEKKFEIVKAICEDQEREHEILEEWRHICEEVEGVRHQDILQLQEVEEEV